MNKKDIIINFENNMMKRIIQKLNDLKFNDFVQQISENSKKILEATYLEINEDFDFEIHFEVITNYIMNYVRHSSYNNDHDFFNIVLNDFHLYWKNIKTPKLVY